MILGNCYPSGEHPAIGRIAALDAGLGTGVPGLQIDRRCGSGLQSVLYAAAQIASGAGRVIVAGGVESMSNVEHYALGLRTGIRSGGVELMDRLVRARETAGGQDHPVPGGMLETAENLRRDYSIAREEQDELSVRSHQRAGAAHEAGMFADELVPVTVPGRRGQPDVVVDRDEHPRPDTTLEQLAALRPVRAKLDAASTVTAGNASGQNDGAALCVVTTREEAERRGLQPLLALRSWAVAGVGPEVMGIGPVPATAAALERAGLTLDEIDVIELNEAFAAQVLACLREWKVDADRRAAQPQRLGHLAGPPRRRDRCPHPGHPRPRDAAPRGPLRPGDHVHRRRPGPGRRLRAGGLMTAVAVHHVVTGPEDAPVVVLSNSLGSTHAMWDAQADALAEHFRVVRYDTRGHGGSPVPDGPYDIDDLADDLVALLDTLGLEKAHVVGLSLGGMTAMRLAARHPERVDRLVVLCTGARLEPASAWHDRAATVREHGSAAVAEAVVQRWFTAPYLETNADIKATCEATVAATPAEGYASCCEVIATMDLRPDLPTIGAPTLAIAGADDPATPPPLLQEIADHVQDGRLLVVPGAAHLASAEQPATITPAIIAHLTGASR